jgi:hypothetical protein
MCLWAIWQRIVTAYGFAPLGRTIGGWLLVAAGDSPLPMADMVLLRRAWHGPA